MYILLLYKIYVISWNERAQTESLSLLSFHWICWEKCRTLPALSFNKTRSLLPWLAAALWGWKQTAGWKDRLDRWRVCPDDGPWWKVTKVHENVHMSISDKTGFIKVCHMNAKNVNAQQSINRLIRFSLSRSERPTCHPYGLWCG